MSERLRTDSDDTALRMYQDLMDRQIRQIDTKLEATDRQIREMGATAQAQQREIVGEAQRQTKEMAEAADRKIREVVQAYDKSFEQMRTTMTAITENMHSYELRHQRLADKTDNAITLATTALGLGWKAISTVIIALIIAGISWWFSWDWQTKQAIDRIQKQLPQAPQIAPAPTPTPAPLPPPQPAPQSPAPRR